MTPLKKVAIVTDSWHPRHSAGNKTGKTQSQVPARGINPENPSFPDFA
jgi:hypothetical protein